MISREREKSLKDDEKSKRFVKKELLNNFNHLELRHESGKSRQRVLLRSLASREQWLDVVGWRRSLLELRS